jgi:hypothetical protein
MKRVLIIAVAAVIGAAAWADDFVREGFEGSTFPPAWWKVKRGGDFPGNWVPGSGGPWGAYTRGWAASGDCESSWATLSTYVFKVPAQTEIYYCFYYDLDGGGNGWFEAIFYIEYVDPPGGYLVEKRFHTPVRWQCVSGRAVIGSTARVKAVWHVYAVADWRYECGLDFLLDRVTITDEDPAAVAPASLGRVKALFR